VKGWGVLDIWTLELVVYKALHTSLAPQLSLGSSLLRVMECISSGILISADGRGIMDPCEKENVDTTRHMTVQEREELTEAAQLAMRQMIFRKPYLVLGLEEFPRPSYKKGVETTVELCV